MASGLYDLLSVKKKFFRYVLKTDWQVLDLMYLISIYQGLIEMKFRRYGYIKEYCGYQA